LSAPYRVKKSDVIASEAKQPLDLNYKLEEVAASGFALLAMTLALFS